MSKEGDAYAQKLAAYAEKHICVDPETGKPVPARLWTSGMRRTIETGQYIRSEKLAIGGGEYQPWSGDDVDGRVQEWVQMRPKRWEVLDEIYAGICDGMTYEEIEEVYPAEFARRKKDKLAYRCVEICACSTTIVLLLLLLLLSRMRCDSYDYYATTTIHDDDGDDHQLTHHHPRLAGTRAASRTSTSSTAWTR